MRGRGRQGIAGNNNNNHSNIGGFHTDLLVCFPATHLTLTPKPICSPSRPADPTKRHRTRPTHSLFRSRTGKYSGGAAAGDEIADEPTSPTVTCAGQIRVQPRSRPGSKASASSSGNNKGWLSVVEEMGKLQSKKPLMQFLGAFRSLRFDLHCFGSFHGAVESSTDGDDGAGEEETEEEPEEDKSSEISTSRTIFSKWFMLLEQNQSHEQKKEMKKEDGRKEIEDEELAPPPNALLLMRCRSAPAEGRTATGQAEKALGAEMDLEDDKEKKERVLLMSYDPNFDKLSTEISKETWIVGSLDPLTRSRSWKR
ncbi:uncharacterized protein LOC110024107 [Phalaenopsis equestris]|uniref:uncharacterized protein LOC110024107 n=1 Tax=Phalaenopsis equestris TaxID=78828 RepID=UPI0009E26A61|nr:uncharacterized protein LOC110024107 [Phalaenopsis equestris]